MRTASLTHRQQGVRLALRGLRMGRGPRDLLEDPWGDTEEETSSGR